MKFYTSTTNSTDTSLATLTKTTQVTLNQESYGETGTSIIDTSCNYYFIVVTTDSKNYIGEVVSNISKGMCSGDKTMEENKDLTDGNDSLGELIVENP